MPYQKEYHYKVGDSLSIGPHNIAILPKIEGYEFCFYITIKKPDHFQIKSIRDCIRWLFYRVSPETYVIHGNSKKSADNAHAIINLFFGHGDTTFVINSSTEIYFTISNKRGDEYEQNLVTYQPHYTAPPNFLQTVFKI